MRKMFVLAVFLGGLFIYVYYTGFTKNLPRNDEASNFRASQIISFESKSTPEFVRNLYWERDFRTNFHVAVGALLLAVVPEGELNWLQGLLTILQYLGYFAGCYFIFKDVKSPLELAGLLLLSISFPWIFGNLTINSSEGMGLVALTWSFVCFQKIDFVAFHKKSNSKWIMWFSIFGGILILAKPVEGILIFGSFFLISVFILQKTVGVAFRTMALLLLALAGPIFYCVYQIAFLRRNDSGFSAAFLVSLSALLSGLFLLRVQFAKSVILLVIPCAIVTYAWYGPFSFQTFTWAFASSFGKMAQLTGGRGDPGWLEFLIDAVVGYFGILFALFVMLIAIVFAKWDRFKIAFVIALLVPLLCGSLTYNGDFRYYAFTGIGLFFVIFSSARKPSLHLKITLIPVFAVLFAYHSLSVFGYWEKLPMLSRSYVGIWPKTFQGEEDNLLQIIEGVKGKIDLAPKNKFCLLRMVSNTRLDTIFDPWVSTYLLHNEGYRTEIIMPFPHSRDNAADRFTYIIKPDCCFVGVFPTQYVQAPVGHYMNDVGELFLKRQQDNRLNELGYTFLNSLRWNFFALDAELKIFRSNSGICKE